MRYDIERTAAALYVVSHHVVGYGQLPLDTFAAACHAKGVPVIADLASECDLRGFLKAGADVAVYSAHKFLGGMTAGIVAGRKDLVRATFLQNYGIGRGMKVGKESIVAAMAALEAWARRDHAGIRAKQRGYLNLWTSRFSPLTGVKAEIIPDPTGNPIDRLKLSVDPERAGITAWDLADALAAGDPPVIIRDHEIELGFFEMDPCNLHEGEAEIVARRVVAVLETARGRNDRPTRSAAERKAARFERLLRWPD
jgi:L-seryl-tRNA(Ser) seleniumtransferase